MVRWFLDRSPQRGIPSVSLRRLLPDARFLGCHDLEVSGCSADSRRLQPGEVFVAVRGRRRDGHAFVTRALERGAVGVVVEQVCPEAGPIQVVVPDSKRAHARLCQALAGDPSEHLKVVGVTGSYGTTATSLFLQAIWEAAGTRFGAVTSQGWSDGLTTHPVGRAAPGAEALAAMLAGMLERGCVGGAIALSHEALEALSAEGIRFDAAVITHLRDGPALAAEALWQRRRVLGRLFRMVAAGGVAVVNADDPDAEILGAVNLETRRVSFGLEPAADITGQIDRLDRAGARFRLRGFDREAAIHLRLVGSQVVAQALAAAALAWHRELPLDAVVAGLEAVESLPGRLEGVFEGQDFDVRIDEVRTGPRLRRTLEVMRQVCPGGRIHGVLGAEGLGARQDRRALAAAAEAGADQIILTTDNPRTENPDQIVDDLLSGLRRPGRARIEPDRRLAIEAALASAQPGDGVLIAGKGRRTFQIFADHAAPFDDRAVVTAWLRTHRPASRRSSA